MKNNYYNYINFIKFFNYFSYVMYKNNPMFYYNSRIKDKLNKGETYEIISE